MIVAPVQGDVYKVIGNFIQASIGNVGSPPAPLPVIQETVNRTAMPPAVPGFVTMQAVYLARLRTNLESEDLTDPDPTAMAIEKGTQIDVQLDFYGADSQAYAEIISTLWRSSKACDALAPTCQPLYADEATMVPLIDGEEEYEQRWLLRATLQYNPVVTAPQQYADAAAVLVINVEEAYPP